MKLEKGGIILVDGIWYVIVGIYLKGGEIDIDCLCDHANNIHSWRVNDIEYVASLKEIYDLSYSRGNDNFFNHVAARSIPFEVIASVLSGHEDHRFGHWHE